MAGRFFNTAGPVEQRKHYCLSPFDRLDVATVLSLIEQEHYFVLHAPRQTGKTSALLGLMEYLNRQGTYRCVYLNVEVGQAAREDVTAAMQAIRRELVTWARLILNDSFVDDIWDDALHKYGPYSVFGEVLSRWAEQQPVPLVVLIDEIDALIGDTLLTLLRQLRAGYALRPRHFPQSVVLCGVRDVRDYRIHSTREHATITGGSAFNIKAESLRLGDFSRADVEALYAQHTTATGQVFAPEAIDCVWEYTEGQPWLVNALGYEACFRNPSGRDRAQPISAAVIDHAREALIQRRDTHLDQLTDKLEEPRVHRVIAPLLAGEALVSTLSKDDVAYVVDLGLIKQAQNGALRIANPLYQEIIPRELTWDIQSGITEQTTWYLAPNGSLHMTALLTAFQSFFREHSEHWVERFQYKEAGPQLLLQAFLQRLVNGGGRIEREYGLGRMRTDLLVLWPAQGALQKIVIELKILYKTREQTIADGLEQTLAYMDRCAAIEGHLIIFDRTPNRPWEEKLFHRQEYRRGQPVHVWGM